MERIAPFESGRPLLSEITADKLNRILTEIRRNRPVVTAPLSARVTQDGTCISLSKTFTASAPSATTARQPWDLVVTTDPESESEPPAYLVSVRPGTLNGMLPSNYTSQTSIAGSNENLHYAKAVVATDGQAITGVTIEIDENAPPLQTPQAFGISNPVKYLFGLFLDGAAYRVIGDGHITISPKLWLTTERLTAPAAGDLPFRQFFTLR